VSDDLLQTGYSRKKYTVSDQLMEQLTTFESYSLSSMEEYRLNSNFSSGMNRWLPSRDSRVLWIVRHPFSFRWPTIDMYDDIQKLRAAYPVAADYVDFLFKVTPPSFNIEFLAPGHVKIASEASMPWSY